MAAQYLPPQSFVAGPQAAEAWNRWRQRYEIYYDAADIEEKPVKKQRAILLQVMGEEGLEIYNSLTIAEKDDERTTAVILDAMTAHFVTFKNVTYLRHLFFTERQKEGQSYDQYLVALKTKAKDCEFGELKNSLIKDIMIIGILDEAMRQRLLKDPNLNLEKALNLLRDEASAKNHAKYMADRQEAEVAHALQKQTPIQEKIYSKKQVTNSQNSTVCSHCGSLHDYGACPASGKSCHIPQELDFEDMPNNIVPAVKQELDFEDTPIKNGPEVNQECSFKDLPIAIVHAVKHELDFEDTPINNAYDVKQDLDIEYMPISSVPAPTQEIEFKNVPIINAPKMIQESEFDSLIFMDGREIKQELTNDRETNIYDDKMAFNVEGSSFSNEGSGEKNKDYTYFSNNVKMFNCNLCEKSYQNKSSLNLHLKIHAGTAQLHKCTTCGKVFSTPSCLVAHLLSHIGFKPFNCEICNKRFSQYSHMKAHLSTHSTFKSHQCEICSKKFCDARLLRSHSITHTAIKPCICGICSKKFKRSSDLKRHSLTHPNVNQESGQRLHKCEICSKEFKRDDTLKNHMLAHRNDKYKCALCNMELTNISNLKSHLSVHLEVKRNESCVKEYKTSTNGKSHMLLEQSSDNARKCGVCNRQFSFPYQLRQHLVTHSGFKPYECATCNKKFTQPSGLKIHIKIIHGGVKAHKCKVCNKEFGVSSQLTNHMVTHSGIKAYECSICNKKFSISGNLKTHMLLHSGIKPYICDICGWKCARSSGLRLHMVTHCKL